MFLFGYTCTVGSYEELLVCFFSLFVYPLRPPGISVLNVEGGGNELLKKQTCTRSFISRKEKGALNVVRGKQEPWSGARVGVFRDEILYQWRNA